MSFNLTVEDVQSILTTLSLVYDIAKPNSFQHVQSMVREWWSSFQEPVAFPDGSVELLQLPCPRAGEGPIRIAVLDD
jgi:hypothetical protein